jgi:hypothetical protein
MTARFVLTPRAQADLDDIWDLRRIADLSVAAECEVFYWCERNVEVDFVTRHGQAVTALEVKSGRAPAARSGLAVYWSLQHHKRFSYGFL